MSQNTDSPATINTPSSPAESQAPTSVNATHSDERPATPIQTETMPLPSSHDAGTLSIQERFSLPPDETKRRMHHALIQARLNIMFDSQDGVSGYAFGFDSDYVDGMQSGGLIARLSDIIHHRDELDEENKSLVDRYLGLSSLGEEIDAEDLAEIVHQGLSNVRQAYTWCLSATNVDKINYFDDLVAAIEHADNNQGRVKWYVKSRGQFGRDYEAIYTSFCLNIQKLRDSNQIHSQIISVQQMRELEQWLKDKYPDEAVYFAKGFADHELLEKWGECVEFGQEAYDGRVGGVQYDARRT